MGYRFENFESVDEDAYLPACEAGLAQEMATGLNPGVFIPLCAYLT